MSSACCIESGTKKACKLGVCSWGVLVVNWSVPLLLMGTTAVTGLERVGRTISEMIMLVRRMESQSAVNGGWVVVVGQGGSECLAHCEGGCHGHFKQGSCSPPYI